VRAALPRLALLASLVNPASAAETPRFIGETRLEALRFSALQGWAEDDHEAALAAFRRSCAAILDGREALRSAQPASEELKGSCRLAADPALTGSARAFFEQAFLPFEVVPPSGRGFLTGYFEPEYEGSLTRSEAFPVPLLARPDDLVTVPQGESWPGLDGLQAGRRGAAGYEPYPDRAAIEDGALGPLAKPILFLRDAVDAMIVHVQGSARIRLPDGAVVRVAYAGKSGHPFTAVGRIIVERGHIPLAEMTLARLTEWLKGNPAEAREIMRLNRSYIFFRRVDDLAPEDGPLGGAGVPLTAGRTLAVDRSVWSYGLPFWLEGEWPSPDGAPTPLARLTIAQDTGSAILGPARGDLFVGSGAAAGTQAGLLRHKTRFVVLLPNPPPAR
jgi:membrane-bound lytic murein transglycosylase A